jgi:hypothetical protein
MVRLGIIDIHFPQCLVKMEPEVNEAQKVMKSD